MVSNYLLPPLTENGRKPMEKNVPRPKAECVSIPKNMRDPGINSYPTRTLNNQSDEAQMRK